MKRILFATVASLSCFLASAAPTPASVRVEVEALLAKLQTSGCEFSRNGSWYSGSEAKSHLLRKLEYLEGKGTIHSAEEFIELAASKSSASGQAYLVKCGRQPAIESKVWLTEQLPAIRVPAGKDKP